MFVRVTGFVGLLTLLSTNARPATFLPITTEERAERASAIAVCEVLGHRPLRDNRGTICSDVVLRVRETLKGHLPGKVALRLPAGRMGDKGETRSDVPSCSPGDRVLAYFKEVGGNIRLLDGPRGIQRLSIKRRHGKECSGDRAYRLIRDKEVQWASPGADLRSDQSGEVQFASGSLLTNVSTGIPHRHTWPDRSEPIPCKVDMDILPPGISSNQALTALSNAFHVWEQEAPITFEIVSIESFGMSAAALPNRDRHIYIQLHDQYNYITSETTLGVAGRSFTYNNSKYPEGGLGGQIGSSAFDHTSKSWLILDHTKTTLQDVVTFEEVLGHELGHTISIAHSSEDEDEQDTTLRQALMFFRVHKDGRGASLNPYDTDAVAQIFPSNLPPYGYDRVMDVVTATPPPAIPYINELLVQGFDRDGDTLTAILTNTSTNNGTFSLNEDRLSFSAPNLLSGPPLDPAGNSSYSRTDVRLSDGVNLSPPFTVRVVAMLKDTRPIGASDGLPDDWMITHFGSKTPSLANLSRADDDPDGDGYPNLEEFWLGTIPTDATSAHRVTTFSATDIGWVARPYYPYQVFYTTGPVDTAIMPVANPVIPTSGVGQLTLPASADQDGFYTVNRIR